MNRLSWIMLLLLPFLGCAFMAAALVTVPKVFQIELGVVAVLFGAIALYLGTLLIRAWGKDGGELEETVGFTDTVKLPGQPGIMTYVTIALFGPLTVFWFNQQTLFSRATSPRLGQTERHRLGSFVLILSWLLVAAALITLVSPINDRVVDYVAMGLVTIILIWWLLRVIRLSILYAQTSQDRQKHK